MAGHTQAAAKPRCLLTLPSSGFAPGKPLMSNVRLMFLAPSTRRIRDLQRLAPVTPRGGEVAVSASTRLRSVLASSSFAALPAVIRCRA